MEVYQVSEIVQTIKDAIEGAGTKEEILQQIILPLSRTAIQQVIEAFGFQPIKLGFTTVKENASLQEHLHYELSSQDPEREIIINKLKEFGLWNLPDSNPLPFGLST